MNYKYTIFNLSYVIILRKYLLVTGLGDIKVKYIKHVFMKFVCAPPCQLVIFYIVVSSGWANSALTPHGLGTVDGWRVVGPQS